MISRMGRTLILVLVLAELIVLIPYQASAKPPFVLHVWPQHIRRRYSYPVSIHVALKNMTDDEQYIWTWFNPVPFGRGKYRLKSLKMRCYNLKTCKEVRYLYPFPNGMTEAEGQGKELPDKVPAGHSIGSSFNLTSFCNLLPGDYILVMQYDTTEISAWIKPDKRAWHGVTNQVRMTIHIAKSRHHYHLRAPSYPQPVSLPPVAQVGPK